MNWGDGLYAVHFSDPNTGMTVASQGVLAKGMRATSIEDNLPRDAEIPRAFSLHQNYPNPFNPATTIQYDVPKATHVRLVVYDALGRIVESLVNSQQPTGSYSVGWDAGDLPSGVYFYRFEAGNYTATRSLILTK
jgi:hypothetical protein